MGKDIRKFHPQETWIHFVAVGGKGMGALAVLMAEKGFIVTGSDGPLYPPMSDYLESSPLQYKSQYSESNLDGKSWGLSKKNPDIVVVGNAISKGHCEAEQARVLFEDKQLLRMSFSEALAEFAIRGNESFVVAGTHGKSTSSSLMAWAMQRCQLRPGFFIGAIPSNFKECARLSETPQFVTEGDEYDTVYWDKVSKFLYYLPDWVMCTGIEFDHADIFPNLESIEESFLALVEKTHKGWVMIEDSRAPVAKSVQRMERALRSKGLPCLRYGFDKTSDVWVSSFSPEVLSERNGLIGMKFELHYCGRRVGEFRSSLVGEHNILNAAGVLGTLLVSQLISEKDIPSDIFVDYLGIAKRQEELFSSDETVLIDDFAHHPRAIKETLAALKIRYPRRRLRAFFEPRSATSARNLLLEDFKKCFDSADEVYLVNATKDNVPIAERLNVAELKGALEARGKKVYLSVDVEGIYQSYLKRSLSEPELIVLMSNASFGGLAAKILGDLR